MDRTTKALLALIAVALWAILLRPLVPLSAAQARPQAAPVAASPAPVMAAVGNSVFILRGHTLSAWDLHGLPVRNQFGMVLPGPELRLRLIDTKTLP